MYYRTKARYYVLKSFLLGKSKILWYWLDDCRSFSLIVNGFQWDIYTQIFIFSSCSLSLSARTQSDIICPCTVVSCASRMKERGRAHGGCWTLRGERVASLHAGEPLPWTTTASSRRAADEQPRKRSVEGKCLLTRCRFTVCQNSCFELGLNDFRK